MTELTYSQVKLKLPRTLWHRFLGKEFELLLTPVEIEVVTEVQVSSVPPLADILLLRRHSETWTPAQLQFLPDGIRDSRASHILIEFKFRETFEEDVIRQAIGYDYFYQQGQQLQNEDLATFVIAAQTPQAETLAATGFHATAQPGVYRHGSIAVRRVTLLVLNELEPTLHNAFVQCFATHRRVRVAAFRRIKELGAQALSEELWHFLYGLQQQWQQKGGEMNNVTNDDLVLEEELTPQDLIESGREWRDLLLASMTPEERLAGMAPAERLAGMAPAERLAGMTPEEMAILQEEIARQLRQTKTSA
ncbi:MAG: hypothetical protein ACOYNY_12235 [Caldilineaceae bacterium]|jgi:hypothetical protein